MNETAVVLRAIRDELEKQSQETVGNLDLTGETLSVLNGAVKLRAAVPADPDAHPAVAHCHVVADLADRKASLDACVTGIHPDRREGLVDAAHSWVETVASPVLSLLHARPVMGAAHFDGSEGQGVAGCHGFVGPMRARFFTRPFGLDGFSDVAVFDYAAELAPPGIVHLAKVTLEATANGRWNRNLEIDGHVASYADRPWNVEIAAPSRCVASQFAVFHYADQPQFIETRQRTDDAIRRFVSAFQRTDVPEKAAEMLLAEGVDPVLAHRVAAFVPLALGRVVLSPLCASFAPDFVRITRDGTAKAGAKLMHEPVFARTITVSHAFMESGLLESVKKIALASPELHSINNALHAGSKPENLKLLPPIIPDPGTGKDAVEQAMEQLRHRAQQDQAAVKKPKPWWQFW